METLKITVKSKEDARLLADLIKQLKFVTAVDFLEEENKPEVPKAKFSSQEDFLSMCGLWKDRDTSVEIIREQAWRRIKL